MPRSGSLSVFQTQGLVEHDIWTLGLRHVVQPGRRLHGRAENEPAHFYAAGLQLIADDHPSRHVEAIGWPSDGERKDAQKEIAFLLASRAKLVRCLPPLLRE
jgi:hypothetical protein